MRKVNYIYLIIFTALLFVACSSDDMPEAKSNDRVEFSYAISNFNIDGVTTRATDVGSPAEQQIDNLYLFLFDMTGANAIKYFANSATFTNGEWSAVEGKVTLKLTQAEAGERQVYIVANVSTVLQTALAGVSTLTQLQAALEATDIPWSPTLVAPILMSGNATHNFVTNRILGSVQLIRALAKIELNVTLPAKHQDADASHYKYNFIDFDKNSYVLKPAAKPEDLATSGWQPWQAASDISSYTTLGTGEVATLKVVTYINECDNAGSYIDIQLPYNAGPLPPPEFGDDIFKLPLPNEIKRNHWYKFDITL